MLYNNDPNKNYNNNNFESLKQNRQATQNNEKEQEKEISSTIQQEILLRDRHKYKNMKSSSTHNIDVLNSYKNSRNTKIEAEESSCLNMMKKGKTKTKVKDLSANDTKYSSFRPYSIAPVMHASFKMHPIQQIGSTQKNPRVK